MLEELPPKTPSPTVMHRTVILELDIDLIGTVGLQPAVTLLTYPKENKVTPTVQTQQQDLISLQQEENHKLYHIVN